MSDVVSRPALPIVGSILRAPEMLSVLRILTGLLFLEHGTGKLLGFPAGLPFIDQMPAGLLYTHRDVGAHRRSFDHDRPFHASSRLHPLRLHGGRLFHGSLPAELLPGQELRRAGGAVLLRFSLPRRSRLRALGGSERLRAAIGQPRRGLNGSRRPAEARRLSRSEDFDELSRTATSRRFSAKATPAAVVRRSRELYTDDCVLDAPPGVFVGHDALDKFAGDLRATHPRFAYTPHGEPQALHNAGRLAWGSGPRGEARLYRPGRDRRPRRQDRSALCFPRFNAVVRSLIELGFGARSSRDQHGRGRAALLLHLPLSRGGRPRPVVDRQGVTESFGTAT